MALCETEFQMPRRTAFSRDGGGGGTSISRGLRGLGLASSLEAKFGVRSPNKRKNLGSSGTTRGKNWDMIPRIFYFFCSDVFWKNKFNSEFNRKLEHQTWKTGWKNINAYDTDLYEKIQHP